MGVRRYRRLPLEGLQNVRDLGGYAAMDGRQTAYGRFIRSEVPNRLTAEDLDFLRRYGVGLSLDFRGDSEILRLPSRLAERDWVQYIRCPAFHAQVAQGTAPQDKEAGGIAVDWPQLYIDMAEQWKPWIRAVIEAAAGCSGAVHYHCTTGKDRTGVISMLLLGLVGVSDMDIIADYAVSQIYLREAYLYLRTVIPGMEDASPDAPFFRTEPRNMALLLDHITGQYGSMEAYALDCGIGRDAIGSIREMLLD